jgi:hypothetical protein
MLAVIPADAPVTGPDGQAALPDYVGSSDGWRYLLFEPNGEALVSDTATDLVAKIIGLEYEGLPDNEAGSDEAFGLRYDFLLSFAAFFQTIKIQDAIYADHFDLEATDDETLTILFQERTVPFETRDGATPVWNHPVPLILIAVDYAPYSSRPKPVGNVIFVDPYTETSFLDAYCRLSSATLYSLG